MWGRLSPPSTALLSGFPSETYFNSFEAVVASYGLGQLTNVSFTAPLMNYTYAVCSICFVIIYKCIIIQLFSMVCFIKWKLLYSHSDMFLLVIEMITRPGIMQWIGGCPTNLNHARCACQLLFLRDAESLVTDKKVLSGFNNLFSFLS